jgi:hypothetical protein
MRSWIAIGFYFIVSLNLLIAQESIDLSGNWKVKVGNQKEKQVSVPGLSGDAKKSESVIYKKSVQLPKGKWNRAVLELNGARFDPSVWINDQKISEAEGGMAPVFLPLNSPKIKPGQTVEIEIRLKSLSDISDSNASRIPEADRWRSNISSCLWDKVFLHTYTDVYLERIIPKPHPNKDSISFFMNWNQNPNTKTAEKIELTGLHSKPVFANISRNSTSQILTFAKPKDLMFWSPDKPNLYQLTFKIYRKTELLDSKSMSWSLKEFKVKNKQFELNGRPFQAKAVTVVWHRWLRDPEGQALGWDTSWFKKNILLRAKDLGANTLRFHLGSPPISFLDLCDRYGMAVQFEWLFFHGMKASRKSLENQWRSWLDLSVRHPSVCMIHPWNETEGKDLETAWAALNTILPEYPPLVIAERDVLHLHKYWWSMFENLGLYYDDFQQFPMAVMADEFGGNYLDGKNQPGGYKTLKESFLRFCGPRQTEADRTQLHFLSNTKVAEYWRRLDVAGFSPFCALGSWEDGNHWFLDSLKQEKPKPVWDGLSAAYASQSVSLEIWDRNFEPYQEFSCPLHFLNDGPESLKMKALLCLFDSTGKRIWADTIRQKVGPYGHERFPVEFMMPNLSGNFTLKAILVSPKGKKSESVWPIRIIKPKRYSNENILVSTLSNDLEIKRLIGSYFPKNEKSGVKPKEVLVCKASSFQKLSPFKRDSIKTKIRLGLQLVLLDAGPQWLGAGYPEKGNENPFQAQPVVKNPKLDSLDLPLGVKLKFVQAAEPESHLHANQQNEGLWKGLKKDNAWLWNGYRGGLVVPAAQMEISGLGPLAQKELWQKRGADISQIDKGLIAYELQGFYEFSMAANDKSVIKKLREKVAFLVADAPALQASVNPNAPIQEINLKTQLQNSVKAEGKEIQVLAVCGKNLSKTPVVQIEFGAGQGKILVSQLLMENRLAPIWQNQNVYAPRKDPSAIQMLINMIESF